MGTVIAVTSGKGGTGKTSITSGVAAALVGQAAQELLRIGVRAMVADVWQRNDPATQFFDKMHFETTQPVRLYPGINL